MLTYNLADTGSDAIYTYLYKCIRQDILSGKIKAGQKLPSKRALAKNLGISVITVEGAYGLLTAEGYVYSLPKKGFYAADPELMPAVRPAGKADQSADGKGRAAGQTIHTGNVVLTGGSRAYLADLTSNQTDTAIFPFSIWTRTMREVMAEKQEALMVNPPCGGIMALRESIAAYLADFRGMSVNPEQVIIGAGTEYLYSLLIQLLGRRCRYGVENPGYHKAARVYEEMGAGTAYIGMDEEGIRIDELEAKAVDVIHVSPSHHFPTGHVTPISRRYELLAWASRGEGRYIIEDDYDSELRLGGKMIPTLQSIDASGRVIYMNTFTKTLCSTVRISYMVLPYPLCERFYEKLSFYSCTVSNFEQYTLARFMADGSFEKHINRLRSFYQKKRDSLLTAIRQSPLAKRAEIYEEEAGVHFLMKIRTDREEEAYTAAVRAGGVRLKPLSAYYFREEGAPPAEGRDNTYVINYSSVREEVMAAAVQVLFEAAVTRHKSKNDSK